MSKPIRSMPEEWEFRIKRYVAGTEVCYHVDLRDSDGQILTMQFFDLESFARYFKRKIGPHR